MEIFDIKELEKKGFEGIDAGLDMSLFEYGMAWLYDEEKKEYKVYFGCNYDDDIQWYTFQYSWISEEDIRELFEDDSWVDVHAVWDSCGFDDAVIFEEWKKDVSINGAFQDLISYYGMHEFFQSYTCAFHVIDLDVETIQERLQLTIEKEYKYHDKIVVTSTVVAFRSHDLLSHAMVPYTIEEDKGVYYIACNDCVNDTYYLIGDALELCNNINRG